MAVTAERVRTGPLNREKLLVWWWKRSTYRSESERKFSAFSAWAGGVGVVGKGNRCRQYMATKGPMRVIALVKESVFIDVCVCLYMLVCVLACEPSEHLVVVLVAGWMEIVRGEMPVDIVPFAKSRPCPMYTQRELQTREKPNFCRYAYKRVYTVWGGWSGSMYA